MFVATQLARLLVLGVGTWMFIIWVTDMIIRGYSSDPVILTWASCFILFYAWNPRT